MKNFVKWMENLSTDNLQNELVLILHHVGDIKESLRKNEIDYALAGLKDIEESVQRLSEGLSKNQVSNMNKAMD